MKITICGSMNFAPKMIEVKDILEDRGYEVLLPLTVYECAKSPDAKYNENIEFCRKNDVTMDHFKKVEASDAILVINPEKNGISGYIGGSTLMEIGLAYYLNKRIFVLHNLPSPDELRHVVEINIINPIILNGEVENIFNHIS